MRWLYTCLLIPLLINTVYAGSDRSTPTSNLVNEDIKALKALIENQFSFYPVHTHSDLEQQLNNLSKYTLPADTIPYRLTLQKLIAAFGDAHAGVRDLFNIDLSENEDTYKRVIGEVRAIPGKHPQLVFMQQGKFVYENNKTYCTQETYNTDFPYLVAIDDISIDEWVNLLKPAIASYNQARIYHKAARFLKYLNQARALTGHPISNQATLTLASEDGQQISQKVNLERWHIDCRLNTNSELHAIDLTPSNHLTTSGQSRIMYLRLSEMFDITDSQEGLELLNTLSRFKQVSGQRGLILDMRDNGGGSRTSLIALYPFLVHKDAYPRITNVATYLLPENETATPWGYPDSDKLFPRFMFRQDNTIWSQEEQQAVDAFQLTKFTPDLNPVSSQKPQGWHKENRYSAWHYQVLSTQQSFFRKLVQDFTVEDEDDATIQKNLLGLVAIWDQLLPDYKRPKQIVVLTDAGIFSAADIMVSALKGQDGVTLMGSSTSGGSSMAITHELPSGTEIKLGSMLSFTPDGHLYDSNGITPDKTLQTSPSSFYFKGVEDQLSAQITHPEDALLKAAIRFIKTQKMVSRSFKVGPIWDHGDAKRKCPSVCYSHDGRWNNVWWTVITHEMSVCQCEVPVDPAQ